MCERCWRSVPELSDVEGYRRYFTRHGLGKPVVGVDVLDRELLRNATPQALSRALKGREFERASRHGKWLIAETGGPELLLHFGMTGLLNWSPSHNDRHPHDRLIFVCETGELFELLDNYGVDGYIVSSGGKAVETASHAALEEQLDEIRSLIRCTRWEHFSALLEDSYALRVQSKVAVPLAGNASGIFEESA